MGSVAREPVSASFVTPMSNAAAPPTDPPPLHLLDTPETPEKLDAVAMDAVALQATVDAAVDWQARLDFTVHDGETWEPTPTQVTFANECV